MNDTTPQIDDVANDVVAEPDVLVWPKDEPDVSAEADEDPAPERDEEEAVDEPEQPQFEEPDYDPEFLKQAEAVGLTPAQLDALDDKAVQVVASLSSGVVGEMDAGGDGGGDTEPAVAPLPFEPIEVSDDDTVQTLAEKYNAKLAEVFEKGVPVKDERVEQLEASLKEREDALAAITSRIDNMQAERELELLDQFVSTLGTPDIYGDGSSTQVDDEAYAKREELMDTAAAIGDALQRRGRQVPSDRELLKRAHYQLHGEKAVQKAKYGRDEKARSRQGQFIAQPRSSGATAQDSENKKAWEEVARKHGIPMR